MTEDKAVEQKVDDGAEKSASAVNAHYRVLAVTACPTGIAIRTWQRKIWKIQERSWGFP